MGGQLRRGVEEVDAEFEGAADGGEGFVVGDGPEDVPERGGAEADAADLDPRASELPPLQKPPSGRLRRRHSRYRSSPPASDEDDDRIGCRAPREEGRGSGARRKAHGLTRGFRISTTRSGNWACGLTV